MSALGGVLEGGQALGGPAVHVLLQACRFGGLQEQPELGSTPENVVNRKRPFLDDQVIHLAGIQPGAEAFAEILNALGAL